jgi:REP element-mobilizing transposase RayT
MADDKFLNKYRISSARAKWHAYDGGEYFVTVCTAEQRCHFGFISYGQIQLTPIGKYLAFKLENVSNHYPYAEIPLFVVMPNHLHAVVFIDGNKIPGDRRVTDFNLKDAGESRMYKIGAQSGWLSIVMGGIKSAVTKYAHENQINFAWHPRFHDRIIRNSKEMNRISDYIENNIALWNTDCFYCT